MRWFDVTIEWGRRRGWRGLETGSADRAAMIALRGFRENWRGPKPLTLTITVTPARKRSVSKRKQ